MQTVASLFKLFFAELPEPLVPFRFYDDLIALADDDDRIVALLNAEFPTSNLELLFFVSSLLAEVCSHSRANKMTPKSLGIIFGPTLLRQRHGELTNERLVSDTAACSRVCEVFIRRAASLEPSADRRTVRASSVADVNVQWSAPSAQYSLIPNLDDFDANAARVSSSNVSNSDMSLTSVDFSDLDAMRAPK